MILSKLLFCVLATIVAAAPAEEAPVAPVVTLYHDLGWTGLQFDVRSMNTCLKVTGSLYGHVQSAKLWPTTPPTRFCTLYSTNNCESDTAILYVTTSNSPVNIRRNTDVRSVFCKDVKK
ncbi:uncharacterized protein TRIVIDRAFT_55747 [Trichoderma virens Gv29-8]|uniref:Uncharacterized protein n=1 Tax=Hypocrea virens (strain Gv29-8 / FGSC 10586) TaxID=413071 RepID=G9MFZ7_HYPVG|nr:uncharacterized protein TRIVIDRAFT_55747 [Trichoderma virens Gv29-8]EHK26448.1 hypothetical protein TRIVIDRAFT_55747 [Trichoderma virens Gv29-8]UKZ46630.1 hypothetical protein TrVGV298_000836 [Trichoderma virens]